MLNEADKTTEISLVSLANLLVTQTNELMSTAVTEEDLRIGFEKILEPAFKELGVKPNPRYEKSVYSGRTDALHGQVDIEYEAPRAFESQRSIDHAYEQLVGYIQNLSKSEKETLFIYSAKFVGVGFDSNKIFFVRYKGDSSPKIELNNEDFTKTGTHIFNEQSARTLLTHLRALSRLPLTAQNLAQKFGPQSEISSKTVSAFANALEHWGDQAHIRTFFNGWKGLFGTVYGVHLDGCQPKEGKVNDLLK